MQSEVLRDLVVEALDDLKGKDIRKLDVRDLTDIADYMVIASGTSDRHVKALADNVRERALEQGVKPLGTEGEDSGEWVLVDFGDVLVHVMQQQTREFYDLEKLWGEDLVRMVRAQRERGE
jgi:ribosome-associated protein